MKDSDWFDWKWQMRNRVEKLEFLNAHLVLSEEEKSVFVQAENQFSFSVTPYYLSLADPVDVKCPIRLQFLPRQGELLHKPNETQDPLAEEDHMPVKGLTHRYPDRAIWYISHTCAVYCRFCTRKRKVSNPKETPNKNEWELALDYIESTKELKEIILSGGDPFSLSNGQIEFLLGSLRQIPHLNQIRIHTRYPVTLPMRFDDELFEILGKYFPIYIVTHFNHPVELTEYATSQLLRLARHSILLNQSVLLRGINDSAEILGELHSRLIKSGVRPYYLHQCDEVFGSSDFVVPIEEGIGIWKTLRGRTSGINIPLYVKDLTGGGGKIPLFPQYLVERKDKSYVFRNYKGELFDVEH